jgi:protease secretion system membrane fusion protein
MDAKPKTLNIPANGGTTIEGEVVLPTDPRRPTLIGLLFLLLGFGGFLAWAALAPLDEGVPTQGIVSLDTKRKAVQHPSGGIVKEVLVREGQWVKEGDVLMRLDDANVRAAYLASRFNYATLSAMQSRLLAERQGAAELSFSEDLRQMAQEDAEIARLLAEQTHLFHSRRQALAAELSAIEQSIHGQEAAMRGYQSQYQARLAQESLLKQNHAGLRDLVEEGYAPRNQLRDLERQIAEVEVAKADLQANLQRAKSAIEELRMRAQLRREEYRKELQTQLAEVRRQLDAEEAKYRALSKDLARVEIRAPAEGQVVGLAVQSVGAVVAAGQKLMDIVPADERLLLEAHIPPHLIDAARRGEFADVRFSAFAHAPQLVVEARVISISQDLLAEPNQPPYYLARLEITPDGMKRLGERRLQPGMPAEVVIKTGERTLLTYLLHPLTKRIAASLKEE